jgi:hypothetical protein
MNAKSQRSTMPEPCREDGIAGGIRVGGEGILALLSVKSTEICKIFFQPEPLTKHQYMFC